jgi:hypothetical protein
MGINTSQVDYFTGKILTQSLVVTFHVYRNMLQYMNVHNAAMYTYTSVREDNYSSSATSSV